MKPKCRVNLCSGCRWNGLLVCEAVLSGLLQAVCVNQCLHCLVTTEAHVDQLPTTINTSLYTPRPFTLVITASTMKDNYYGKSFISLFQWSSLKQKNVQSYEPADPHLLLTLTLTHPLSSVLRVSACQGPATDYIETDFSVDNWNETGIFHHPSCSFGFGS